MEISISVHRCARETKQTGIYYIRVTFFLSKVKILTRIDCGSSTEGQQKE